MKIARICMLTTGTHTRVNKMVKGTNVQELGHGDHKIPNNRTMIAVTDIGIISNYTNKTYLSPIAQFAITTYKV